MFCNFDFAWQRRGERAGASGSSALLTAVGVPVSGGRSRELCRLNDAREKERIIFGRREEHIFYFFVRMKGKQEVAFCWVYRYRVNSSGGGFIKEIKVTFEK